ncbi:MAG TPA: glutathione peroxidase [Chitinophagaceae bacterium]|jgi:glutathione peroxidase|nr:MAG: hypothetical protein BWZ05_00956 [Bacteroidetes bacterium ADurb.BinA245]HMW65787.1 glutathione peroxidase [Chitinophagaceae bacterium]HMX76791.1 glutathione peroxidase [Chitinophagaceae bacterium]HNA18938.1 glutathione peroxidase [Chitinophagaceae bacterium]HNC39136.1 glutathione peroxidase [Chitinophagaceae bacterium]
MKLLKRLLLVIFVLLLAFTGYVWVANRNVKNMTFRQKILRTVYPAFMWWSKKSGNRSQVITNKEKQPLTSFYSLNALLNNGDTFQFENLKGKKVLLVNTASNCGFTNQYAALESLYQSHKDRFIILGFPANDFKNQESGTDAEIAAFCKQNFGISFPLMQKSVVLPQANQNPVYQWLTDASKNGWNNKAPSWNFSKYLVDENGVLIDYFGSAVAPTDEVLINAIKK